MRQLQNAMELLAAARSGSAEVREVKVRPYNVRAYRVRAHVRRYWATREGKRSPIAFNTSATATPSLPRAAAESQVRRRASAARRERE